MTTTQAAAKLAPAYPSTEAESEVEAARADVGRLTAAINELRREGPGFDALEYQRLESERESAFQKLRAADLEVAEQATTAAGPLPPKVLGKIRLRRRRVEDLHAAVLALPALVTVIRRLLSLRHRDGAGAPLGSKPWKPARAARQTYREKPSGSFLTVEPTRVGYAF